MINGHGDDLYKYAEIKYNFSSNVCNKFDHSKLFEYMRNQMDGLTSYPEPQPYTLEKVIAESNGNEADEVCATNGATEAIYLIAQAFKNETSAVLNPTFSEYADACRMHNHRVEAVYSLNNLPTEARLVWLCNPNNPTGTVIPYDQLTECISMNKDKIFIIDESYSAFTEKKTISHEETPSFKNVILISSMTKRFAVPGLRIGYITTSGELAERIRRLRMPWPIGHLTSAAAMYLIKHKAEYKIDAEKLINERRRVASELESMGCVTTWPSDTHILLCKLRMGKSSALKEYQAEKHKILIRDASNFNGLDDTFFRIAVQGVEEDNILLDAIEEWLME